MQTVPSGERPNLPARRPKIGGATAQVECPGCGAWRPAFCISEIPTGWLGDCCISDKVRKGTGLSPVDPVGATKT